MKLLCTTFESKLNKFQLPYNLQQNVAHVQRYQRANEIHKSVNSNNRHGIVKEKSLIGLEGFEKTTSREDVGGVKCRLYDFRKGLIHAKCSKRYVTKVYM